MNSRMHPSNGPGFARWLIARDERGRKVLDMEKEQKGRRTNCGSRVVALSRRIIYQRVRAEWMLEVIYCSWVLGGWTVASVMVLADESTGQKNPKPKRIE